MLKSIGWLIVGIVLLAGAINYGIDGRNGMMLLSFLGSLASFGSMYNAIIKA